MLEIQKSETGLVSAKLVIPEEEVPKIKKEEYNKIRKNVVRNGFRKGRVPVELAERMLGLDTIYNRGLSNIVMKELITNNNLMPYQYTKFEIAKDLTVDAEFYPLQNDIEFTCDVKTLKVKEEVLKDPEITEEELRTAKDVLIRQNSMAKEHEKDYAAKNGDDVVVDFKITIKDSEAPPAEKNDHIVSLGFGLLDSRLEEGLVGIKPGETRTIEIELSDSTYKYEVTCKKVYEVDLITKDELLTVIGIESEEELNEKLKKELLVEKKKRMTPFMDTAKITMDRLLDNLKKNSNFKMPEKMLEDLTKDIKSDVEKKLLMNIHRSNYERRSLLLAASDQLGIDFTDEEYDEEIKKIKKHSKKKDVDVIDNMTAGTNILINKVLEILIEKEEETDGKDIQSQQG